MTRRSPELQAEHDRFNTWARDVRDPATAANVEPVRLRHGPYRAEYQIAQIPTGWAWHVHAEHPGVSYSGSPWSGPTPTHDDALDAIARHIARFVRHHPDAAPLLDQLHASTEPTLF